MNSYLKSFLIACSATLSGHAIAGPGGGDIDVSFSGNGYEVLKFAPGADDAGYSQDVLVDASGRIYVIGSPVVNGIRRFGIARYSAQGALDTSFNGTGKAVTDANVGIVYPTAATFDNQGKLLVAGFKYLGNTNHDFFVCRFDTDGSPLPFAGSNNACARPVIDLDADFPVDEAYAVTVDKQNRIVLAGVAYGSGESYGAVVRLNPDGSLDQNFDGGIDNLGPGNGIVLLRTAPFIAFDKFNDVEIGPDGNIYVVGTGNDKNDNPNHRVITVNKLSNNGISFANFDTRIHDVTVGGKNDGATLAFDRNGDIVLGGATNDDGVVLKVDRVTGAPIPGFGNAGVKILTNGDRLALNDLVVTHDNDIIAVGTYTAILGQDRDILALRMNSNGSLDTSFGANGVRTIDMFEVGEDDYAVAVALTPGKEKPVIAGYFDHTDQTFVGEAITLTQLTSDVIFFDTFEND